MKPVASMKVVGPEEFRATGKAQSLEEGISARRRACEAGAPDLALKEPYSRLAARGGLQRGHRFRSTE